MAPSPAGIHQRPAPLFTKSKVLVLGGGLAVIAVLFIIARNQWLHFALVPAPATEVTHKFIVTAYFWSFIITIQVIAASVLYRPRLHQPQTLSN